MAQMYRAFIGSDGYGMPVDMPAPTVKVSEQDCSSDKAKDGSIPSSYIQSHINPLAICNSHRFI